jgi:hypothetical protein
MVSLQESKIDEKKQWIWAIHGLEQNDENI